MMHVLHRNGSLTSRLVRCGGLLALLLPLSLAPVAASLAAAKTGPVAGASASRSGDGSPATSQPRGGPPPGSCLSGGFATCGGFVGPGPWVGEHQPLTGSGAQGAGQPDTTRR